MSSIVGPAIETEVRYRRERIAEDFRRARHQPVPRQNRPAKETKAALTARSA